MTARVAITGLGVFCPIGCEPSAIVAALRAGRSGIGPLTRYPAAGLRSKVAAEVAGAPADLSDRTPGMAVGAARQAWESALLPAGRYAPGRTGLCVGASGAGLNHDSQRDVFRLRFQPQEQAAAVAAALGIAGPVVMFTSASAGSGLALAHAMNLLRSGRCDVVVAGGAECLSQVNHECMDTMRLASIGPCSPFSGEAGLTVGEGSAFFVLERLEDALARRAPVRVELFGFGATQDAYDVVAGDPSGQGLARAFLCALRSTGLAPSEIAWIKANGTSNREQDAAETLAVKQVFQTPPPLCALESFVGHANGAAPAIGLGLALLAFENGLLPPTLHFTRPRPGCDLDYVPNRARAASATRVLASSLGFGGSNVALLFGVPGQAPLAKSPSASLCITGVGVVSPFGVGFRPFIEGLRAGASAIRPTGRWFGGAAPAFAGLVEDLRTRPISNKHTLLQSFALAAAEEAFASAALPPASCDSQSLGVFAGLSRGSDAARNQYAAALSDPQARKSIGKFVMRMARFTVASALSQRFKLEGYGATIAEGFGAGLHALAHACIHLENSSAEQALLVVAADETGPGAASSLAERNGLALGHDGCYLRPYDAASPGAVLAEGAVALLVERTSFAEGRGANIRARIEGVGLSADLSDAMRQAIDQANCAPQEIAAAYGNGSGIAPLDEAELAALRTVLPPPTPLGCVNAGIGFAEAASGLFPVAAALHGLSAGEFFPLSPNDGVVHGSFRRQMLTATSEGRRHAAVVVAL